jgi:hypothetical protein
MKPLIAASMIAAAVAASGCAPPDMSVFVEGASFLNSACTKSGEINLIRGSLDLGPSAAAGTLPRYFGLFGLRSDLEPVTTKVGDDILAGDSRNEFIATSVNISYTLANGASVPQASEPIYFVIPPGTTNNTIQFQMLSPAAATVIGGAVTAGTATTLLITFQFEGNVRSSANGLLPMHTPQVIFPVDVYNQAPVLPTCTAPATASLVGPCGNSQESFSFECQ